MYSFDIKNHKVLEVRLITGFKEIIPFERFLSYLIKQWNQFLLKLFNIHIEMKSYKVYTVVEFHKVY